MPVAFTGCKSDYENEIPGVDFSVKYFTVSGTVYDSSESLPGVPLQDIKITMTAYWYNDTDRVNPMYSETVWTSTDGKYQFHKSWEMSTQNYYYVLKVSDESKSRSVHFKPVEQELYLRAHTDTYDYVTHSYEVRDNDFYLLPE
jgi:hypothetical protein